MTDIKYPEGGFKSFEEFYPFYLSEHSEVVCRTLHFIGTWLGLIYLIIVLTTFENKWWRLLRRYGDMALVLQGISFLNITGLLHSKIRFTVLLLIYACSSNYLPEK